MPVGDVAKVDAYLASLPAPQRQALSTLRGRIQAAAPKAQDGFGYGLPGFYLDGPLFYYGAGKAHCALYGTVPAGFEDDLAAFARSKGAVRFTPEAPLPAGLVRRLVRAKAAENRARATAKTSAPRPPHAARGLTGSTAAARFHRQEGTLAERGKGIAGTTTESCQAGLG